MKITFTRSSVRLQERLIIIFGIVGVVILLVAGSFKTFDKSTISHLQKSLEAYLEAYPPEKVYLHTDKPYYSSGDTIWFAAYLVHGVSHMATAPSKIVYVELINEEKAVLSRLNIAIDNGTGAGEFALADTLQSGVYFLRAYTAFMRNFDNKFFFHKRLSIQNLEGGLEFSRSPTNNEVSTSSVNLIDVQFFPEGGDLVNKMWSTVGVKATWPNGLGAKIDGFIIGISGQKIPFSTNELGIGKFRIYSLMQENYFALIQIGAKTVKTPFPNIKDSGYVMTVSTLSKDYLGIKIESNINEVQNGGFLIGHIRGNVFLTLESKEGSTEALVKKRDLPGGLATLTWFDSKGRPQCERLIYLEKEEIRPRVKFSNLKTNYGKREKVELGISITDADNQPLEGMFSISITDSQKIFQSLDAENIRSYYQLRSEIKGEIQRPGYYFNEQNRKRLEDLDNLLLTQGWRRFTWNEVINKSAPSIIHDVERAGFNIRGKVVEFRKVEKGVSCNVTLTATNRNTDFLYEETLSDSMGNFMFSSLHLEGASNIILQTPDIQSNRVSKKLINGGEINLPTRILIEEVNTPEVEFTSGTEYTVESSYFFEKYLKEMKRVKEIKDAFRLGTDVIILDAVEVSDSRYKEDRRFNRPGMIHKIPTKRIDADSLLKVLLPNTFLDLIQMGKVNGVQVKGNQIFSPRSGEPDYYLDGMRIREDGFQAINSIPAGQIDFIDVLQGPQAAPYQSRFVVMVYTKQEIFNEIDSVPKGIAYFTHAGYYQARQFFSPQYNSKSEAHSRPDFRPTLYWNASVKTSSDQPRIELYTSDEVSIFEIRIEGITKNGLEFVEVQKFEVK